jgi:hypothetical protein
MSSRTQSAETLSLAQVELDTRRVIMPAMVNLFLAEAFERIEKTPTDWDRISFPIIGELDELNFCPAITSTYALFRAATAKLKDGAELKSLITPEQQKHLQELDWAAVSPDHHFKTNFMTSYPAFALGYIYEAAYAGDIQKPETVDEVLSHLYERDFHTVLRQGMFTASGVWAQSADRAPWGVFGELRHLYEYGNESPFMVKDDGSMSLAPKILRFLHGKMREKNLSGEGTAFRCPIAVHNIRDVSDDPDSPAHLSEAQIEGLLKPRADGAIARREQDGSLRIQFEALDSLRDYYVQTALRGLEEVGTPVVIEHRTWPHKNTVRYINRSASVPLTTQPDPDLDCPQTNPDPSVWVSARQPCRCAQ